MLGYNNFRDSFPKKHRYRNFRIFQSIKQNFQRQEKIPSKLFFHDTVKKFHCIKVSSIFTISRCSCTWILFLLPFLIGIRTTKLKPYFSTCFLYNMQHNEMNKENSVKRYTAGIPKIQQSIILLQLLFPFNDHTILYERFFFCENISKIVSNL